MIAIIVTARWLFIFFIGVIAVVAISLITTTSAISAAAACPIVVSSISCTAEWCSPSSLTIRLYSIRTSKAIARPLGGRTGVSVTIIILTTINISALRAFVWWPTAVVSTFSSRSRSIRPLTPLSESSFWWNIGARGVNTEGKSSYSSERYTSWKTYGCFRHHWEGL